MRPYTKQVTQYFSLRTKILVLENKQFLQTTWQPHIKDSLYNCQVAKETQVMQEAGHF